MKNTLTLFLLLLTSTALVSLSAYSQAKKPGAKAAAKDPVYLLNPADYEHYFLVDRTAAIDNESKPYYTLSYPTQRDLLGDNPGSYAGGWVVMDVRTGKEVAWWPRLSYTYVSPANQQLYVKVPNQLWGHTASGQFQYRAPIVFPNGSKFAGTPYFLSSDWKKAVFLYNGDVWLADFDAKTGKLGTGSQVTFAGIFDFIDVFMKDDFILTDTRSIRGGHIVDAKTGKYIQCMNWSDYNTYVTDLFVGANDAQGYSSYYTAKNQTIVPFTGDMAGWQHAFWTDKAQTEYVLSVTKNNATALYYRNPKNGNTLVPLKWPQVTNNTAPFLRSSGDKDLTKPMTSNDLFSPNRQQILRGIDEKTALVGDLGENSERIINVDLYAAGFADFFAWSDNDHFFFTATVGKLLDGKPIDTATQGTYVYDIQAKKATRLTPYLMSARSNDDRLYGTGVKLLRFPKANWVVFEANNYLFRSRPDGSELSMLTKTPQIYTLRKIF